jgi:phosphoenolpyruvate-protein kinase (PTS system EI component)
MVIDAGEAAGKPVIVCGEMAGSPFYAPILIGLGTKHLSMNVSSIPIVGKVIYGIAFEEAVELVRKIETQTTAAKIEEIVHLHSLENWAHLFPPDFLQQR